MDNFIIQIIIFQKISHLLSDIYIHRPIDTKQKEVLLYMFVNIIYQY